MRVSVAILAQNKAQDAAREKQSDNASRVYSLIIPTTIEGRRASRTSPTLVAELAAPLLPHLRRWQRSAAGARSRRDWQHRERPSPRWQRTDSLETK